LSVTRPFDSSPGLYYLNGPLSPCVYLALLWRYGASNIGCTDVDTERKMEKKKGEREKRERESGKEEKRAKKKWKVKGREMKMGRKGKKGKGRG